MYKETMPHGRTTKMLERNTFRVKWKDGSVGIQYRDTVILEFYPDGAICFDFSQPTVATLARMNQFLKRGWSVYQRKGEQIVTTPAGEFLITGKIATFEADGTPILDTGAIRLPE